MGPNQGLSGLFTDAFERGSTSPVSDTSGLSRDQARIRTPTQTFDMLGNPSRDERAVALQALGKGEGLFAPDRQALEDYRTLLNNPFANLDLRMRRGLPEQVPANQRVAGELQILDGRNRTHNYHFLVPRP